MSRHALLAVILLVGANASAEETPSGPVLVELFTSQGCSSCPPADQVLGELAARDGVVALAFHVDYWNRLGWTDPFSSRKWSRRQRSYGNRVYTPQLVVDGRTHVVGSNRPAIEAALRSASKRRHGRIRATYSGASDLRVRVITEGARGDVFVAVFDVAAQTDVPRGENAGRRLRNARIVRHLERIGSTAGAKTTTVAKIRRQRHWSKNVGVAVFVQDPKTRAVSAARYATAGQE